MEVGWCAGQKLIGACMANSPNSGFVRRWRQSTGFSESAILLKERSKAQIVDACACRMGTSHEFGWWNNRRVTETAFGRVQFSIGNRLFQHYLFRGKRE